MHALISCVMKLVAGIGCQGKNISNYTHSQQTPDTCLQEQKC